MAIIDELVSILLASKNGGELPVAGTIGGTDRVLFYSPVNQRIETVLASSFQSASLLPFAVIENSIVKKATGNTNINAIEVNDQVWFKEVIDGSETVTLMGHTYDGGNTLLRGNYTQNAIIET